MSPRLAASVRRKASHTLSSHFYPRAVEYLHTDRFGHVRQSYDIALAPASVAFV